MDVLFRNMAVLIEHPLLAAVPGAAFVALFAVSRKLLVLTAAAAWLAYLPYEYAMKLRLLSRETATSVSTSWSSTPCSSSFPWWAWPSLRGHS
jgi:uncharacterized membrane protein YjjB (DUF3815 family)